MKFTYMMNMYFSYSETEEEVSEFKEYFGIKEDELIFGNNEDAIKIIIPIKKRFAMPQIIVAFIIKNQKTSIEEFLSKTQNEEIKKKILFNLDLFI